MLRARALPLLPLLMLLASACTWSEEEPVVLVVTPARAPDLLDVEVRISGTGFEPDVQVDFDRPGDSNVDAGFGVALVSPTGRVALTGVVRISSTELRATLRAGAAPGTYDVAVTSGGRGEATARAALVVYPSDLAVTTSADEQDAGATPWTPGGAGLSLREAMEWVNGTGIGRAITLAGPLSIAMSGNQRNLLLTPAGAALVAEPGVVVDFGGINQTCITLDGPDQLLSGLTMRGCESTFVKLTTASAGSQVTRVTMEPTRLFFAYGIQAQAPSGANRIGPGNDLAGLWHAVRIEGSGYEIFGNRLHGNSYGVVLTGGAVRLWQNVISGQVRSLPPEGIGVEIANGAGPVELLHNTLDGNEVNGLTAAAVASLTVRNNLFTGNGALGMDARAAGLTHDHNGYFGNAGGDVSAPLTIGATDLLVDPLYVDAASGDYRLLPTSPVIDEGIDTGLDLNGAAAGLFDGAAPDLGATEQ